MLSLARQCRSSISLPQTRQLLGVSSRSMPRNGVLRTYMNPVWRRQPLVNLVKKTNFLKSGAIVVRLSSNIPQKIKKTIGYWLVSCSGMIFVAVVLGITAIYYYILATIYEILDEIIKKTVR